MNLFTEMGSERRQMTGAIFTTYPFDPGFTENAIVSVLSKKGIGQNNVVLVDSSKYEQTFDTEKGNPVSSAGVNYHLAPVNLPGRRVFHPKVYFFAGERRVYAFVGSANLTQKGFTDNAELFSYFIHEKNAEDPDPRQVAILKQIRSFLTHFLESEFAESVGGYAKNLAHEEILPSCSWIDDEGIDDEPRDVRFLHNLDQPIFEQVSIIIGDEPVREAHIAAPYFGESIQMLRRIQDLGDPDIKLYLQQGVAQIPLDELSEWLAAYPAYSITVFDHERFLHGKLLLLKTDESVYCVIGSPNPSQQGMLLSASSGGNVETAILRVDEDVDHFDYLLELDVFEDVVASSVEEFNPTSEPLPEVEPSEAEPVPIRLLDVVFNRETAFTGGRLSIEASVDEDIDPNEGVTVVESLSAETFQLPISDAELDTVEDGSIQLRYDITDDERQSVLNSTCLVRLEVGQVSSNQRWINHKSPEEDDIVREGIESGGTATVPDLFPEFLLGGLADAENVLGLIDDVANGLHSQGNGESGTAGYTRRTLPPDWQRQTSGSPRDADEVVSDLYDAYYQQLLSMTLNQAGEERPDSVTQDFVDVLFATNRLSANIFLAHTNRHEFGVENTGELLSLPRRQFVDLYRGESAVIPRFCQRVVEPGQQDPAAAENGFEALRSHMLPQTVFSAMLVENEDPEHRTLYEFGFEKAANSCLPGRAPTPESIYPKRIADVIDGVEEMVETTYAPYRDSSSIAGYINSEYGKHRNVKEFVIDFHSRMLLAAGAQGVNTYFTRLEKLIRENSDDLALILKHGYRFSARFSNNLDMQPRHSRSRTVDQLCDLADAWDGIDKKYRSLLEYAMPAEV